MMDPPGGEPEAGALPKALSDPTGADPGGIDFSSLDLRYCRSAGRWAATCTSPLVRTHFCRADIRTDFSPVVGSNWAAPWQRFYGRLLKGAIRQARGPR